MLNELDLFPVDAFGDGSPLRGKPTLIVWLRHFGCRFFQEAKLLLPKLHERLGAAGIDLVCVVQGTEEEVRTFWPFQVIRCVPDPDKRSYRLIGLERTSLLKIFFPVDALKKRRAEATSRGCAMDSRGTAARSSDILQLPGFALLDREGKILLIHRGKHTGDLDLSEGLVEQLVPLL
ncbi:MAG TPA: AhpC/TSA family protein [Bacteroidota bacterium]|nr:AhpC/TSA family protein [Bacteroidota bacterium]